MCRWWGANLQLLQLPMSTGTSLRSLLMRLKVLPVAPEATRASLPPLVLLLLSLRVIPSSASAEATIATVLPPPLTTPVCPSVVLPKATDSNLVRVP